jgi:hypothetical protein
MEWAKQSKIVVISHLLNEVVVRLVHDGETPRNNGAQSEGGQGQSSPKKKAKYITPPGCCSAFQPCAPYTRAPCVRYSNREPWLRRLSLVAGGN